MNVYDSLKAGFGQWLTRYRSDVIGMTGNMQEWLNRDLPKAIAFAPSRLVDQAELMVNAWLNNDTEASTTTSYKLPMVLVGMNADSMGTGYDYASKIIDPVYVIIPDDPKERAFKLNMIQDDMRFQIVFFARDLATVKGMVDQFRVFSAKTGNDVIPCSYDFAGIPITFESQLESSEVFAPKTQTEVKNLHILVVDMAVKTSIPLYSAPRIGEPNDGKGVPETDDPAGYLLVDTVTNVGVAVPV
jgi:hypothetical protein